jgi:hypothetical protein
MLFVQLILIVWVVVLSVALGSQYAKSNRMTRQIFKLISDSRDQPEVNRVQYWAQFRCGCDHHSAYHSKPDGRCEFRSSESYYTKGRYLKDRPTRCRCQGYTGPPLPTGEVLGLEQLRVEQQLIGLSS